MRPIQRIISIGFATAAILSASVPALSGDVEPQDLEALAPVPSAMAAAQYPDSNRR